MEKRKDEEANKKIDESWKETVEKEKKGPRGMHDEMPEITFGLFISGLMMEALIALGEVENPVTKKKELSAPHAKFLIDTLAMLKDKTKNNLVKDEADTLDSILYDLRMRYVTKTKG